MSEETKDKIRSKRKLQGNFRQGTKHSNETKIKMSLIAKKNGNKVFGFTRHTDEAKAKMSSIKKELYKNQAHPRLGKSFSKETLLEMSKSHIGKKLSNEARNKISETHKGDKHWNWKEDRSSIKTDDKKHLDTAYKAWARAVKMRDGWKCRITSQTCLGKLESHHILDWINYPELRYQINNGITLCHAHHPRGRAEEKRLAEYFTRLVTVSKDNIWH